MGKHRDWTDIRQEYERGKSLPQIAEQHGISISTLKKVSAREKWIKGKAGLDRLEDKIQKAREKMAPEPNGTAEPEPPGEKAETAREIAERILRGLLADVESMVGAVSSTKELRELTSSFRDLWAVLDKKDDLDREEQEARIAKLRAETRTEDERQELVIRFEDFPEEVQLEDN